MEGTTLGPYRLEKRLGAGGMGEVFKAHDDRLGRSVAIKRILPTKQQSAGFRQRLLREARAIAQLNHPAIVQIYDIFQDGDSDCIVMEFVEGQRLDKLIRESRLDLETVLRCGKEIASGLAEAHSKGILHRDLKTENVLLSAAGDAKLLDFGLARPLRPTEFDASLTAHDQMVGTSRTLSPEYASGDEIDHRSDLFQLGVLLYEACTGSSPFKAQNTLATLKRVILHTQAPVAMLRPEVPPELSELIDRLLEKDPEDRPQSAAEVAEELALMFGSTTSSESMVRSNQYRRPSRLTAVLAVRRGTFWLAALAMLLLALGIGFYFVGGRAGREQQGPGLLQAKDSVVLAHLDNRTGDADLDHSVGTALRVGLNQSRFAYVLPPERVADALDRMERQPGSRIDRQLGIEICQREASKALVSGSVVKVGDNYKISVELIDPGNQRSVFTFSAPAEGRDGILNAVELAARALRANLGESLATIKESALPLEKVTTPHLQALEAYSLAARHHLQGDPEAAILLLEEALEIDPGFAMAHARLGTIYRNLQRGGELAPRHFERALELHDRLAPLERLYVEGWVASTQGEPGEMVRIWSLMSSLYPQHDSGHYNLGMVYWQFQNQYQMAAEALREASELVNNSRRYQAMMMYGYCQLALGEREGALVSFEEARQQQTDQPVAALALVDAYLAERRYDPARQLAERVVRETADQWQVQAKLRLALLEMDRGRFPAALDRLTEVIAQAEATGLARPALVARLARIAVLEIEGDRDSFARELDISISSARQLLGTESAVLSSSPTTLLVMLGKLGLRHGSAEQARQIFGWLAPLAEETGYALRRAYVKILEGEILAFEGQVQLADERLREAITIAEPIQAHESLARLWMAAGQEETAAIHFAWLRQHRSRAFVECVGYCFGRELNVLALQQAEEWRPLTANEAGSDTD